MRCRVVPSLPLRSALLVLFACLPACSASVRGMPKTAEATPTPLTRPGGPVAEDLPMAPLDTSERLHPSDRELAQPGVGEQVGRLVPTIVTRTWLDVVLLAPKGAKVHVDHERARVAGPAFDVEVRPHAPDLFAHKVQVMRSSPGARLASESGDTQVFQSGQAWHFLTMVETGGRYYTCRSAPDRRFTHEEVLTMVRACWSLTSRSVASDDTVR